MIYNKKALTYDEQIDQLKERGLIIDDLSLARHYLETVGYYRLSGYWWPLLEIKKPNPKFKKGNDFKNIVTIYNFDKELRLLIFELIETIEIVFRTKIIYHLSLEISPWWFEDPNNFKDKDAHYESILKIARELKQTKENFIKEHYKKYKGDSRKPPAWKTIEIASFGTISKLYGNLKNSVKSKDIIAKELGTVNHTFLPSWLQSITQIRNIIAHHNRLWNKNLPGRPKLLPKPPKPWLSNVPPVNEHHMLYIHLCCIKYLLNSIVNDSNMTLRLQKLLAEYHNIDPNALGLKPDWENEPLWVY